MHTNIRALNVIFYLDIYQRISFNSISIFAFTHYSADLRSVNQFRFILLSSFFNVIQYSFNLSIIIIIRL